MIKVKAKAKWLKSSALKIRRIIKLIKGRPAEQVMAQLQFMPHKAAGLILKVLKSAVANAKNNYKMKPEQLMVSEAYADSASIMRRIQPRARGSAFPIKKRTSHITVVVSGKEIE